MRPALGKGIADEQLTEDACRAVRMEEVQEMPRPNLVDRGEEQVLLARNEGVLRRLVPRRIGRRDVIDRRQRSEEHTSELQSLMRISYAVFCLKKNTYRTSTNTQTHLKISLQIRTTNN